MSAPSSSSRGDTAPPPPAPTAKTNQLGDLAALRPPVQDGEDSMSQRQSDAAWAKIYKAAGVQNETERKAVRVACYAYACKNGTSRAGTWRHTVKVANGTEFPASAIIEATGLYDVRRFFRKNKNEAYELLKATQAMEYDEEFLARCEARGAPRHAAFATADYLSGCSHLTPEERRANEAFFDMSIDRARRARDGATLEQVEGQALHRRVEVQGPESTPAPVSQGKSVAW